MTKASTSTAGAVAARRVQAKQLARTHRDTTPRDVIKHAIELLEQGERHLAYELLLWHKSALKSATKRDIEKLAAGINSWETVDTFSSYIAGPAWREGIITDALIHRWARSKDRWYRRAALVATVPLNTRARGATAPNGDAARTLAVCEALLDDRDDMVVKALSWALRELAKRDPRAVRAFLKLHGDRIAARARREVTNKLTTGLKNPGKR